MCTACIYYILLDFSPPIGYAFDGTVLIRFSVPKNGVETHSYVGHSGYMRVISTQGAIF
jgi:hypothetical protein